MKQVEDINHKENRKGEGELERRIDANKTLDWLIKSPNFPGYFNLQNGNKNTSASKLLFCI